MATATAQSSVDHHIETTPAVRGGKARIVGTRITVADVAVLHNRLGRSLEEIAGTYDLPMAAVYAAMSYYHDHRLEIDQAAQEDEAFVQAFRHDNPSLLQAKLAALGRA